MLPNRPLAIAWGLLALLPPLPYGHPEVSSCFAAAGRREDMPQHKEKRP